MADSFLSEHWQRSERGVARRYVQWNAKVDNVDVKTQVTCVLSCARRSVREVFAVRILGDLLRFELHISLRCATDPQQSPLNSSRS